MRSLAERIQKGELAVAEAKAEGRDVSAWESHLTQLKRKACTEPRLADSPDCWNCGATMTHAEDIFGKKLFVCWSCAKSA